MTLPVVEYQNSNMQGYCYYYYYYQLISNEGSICSSGSSVTGARQQCSPTSCRSKELRR